MKEKAKKNVTVANVFITDNVVLTGFDKAYTSFYDGRFTRVCFQVKPFWCPSEMWRAALNDRYSSYVKSAGVSVTITAEAICYITFDGLDVTLDDFSVFIASVFSLVQEINYQMAGPETIQILPADDARPGKHPEADAYLDSVTWQ